MSEITVILERLNLGHQEAFDDLVPLVYQELHRRASFEAPNGAGDHTLHPTALVHEAFLRLLPGQETNWQSSRHFYHAAAEVMRQIVLNHARGKAAQKRGGGRIRVELQGVEPVIAADEMDWESLDVALAQLRKMDARRYQVVLLRYFAGLTDAQIALSLEVSEKTVERDWAAAKLFLQAQVQG